MANSTQALKRARQAEKHRQHNVHIRSVMRTHLKRVWQAIQANDKAQAEKVYREAVSVLDKTVGKGIIHANKAARHKSRLNNHIRQMQTTQQS